MINLNHNSALAVAKVIANEASLRLEISDDPNLTPCTQYGTITMPKLDVSWSDHSDEMTHWFYSLIHECCHNTGDNKLDLSYVVENKIDMRSLYGVVLNIVSDHNIENKRYGELEGIDRHLNKGRDLHYAKADAINQEQLAELLSSGTELSDQQKDQINKTTALWWFDHKARTGWSRISYPMPELSKEQEEYYHRLLPLLDDYRAARSGGEPNADMTNRILEALGLDPEEEKQKAQDMAAAGEALKGEMQELAEAMAKASHMLKHDHADTKEQAQVVEGKSNGERDEESKLQPQDNDNVNHKGEGSYVLQGSVDKVPKETSHRYNINTSKLAHKVAQVLRVMSTSKMEGNQKRGKIHRKGVYKVKTGGDRIFRKKVTKDILDTHVSLLIDFSGSMGSRKQDAANNAAIQMYDCLRKIGINCTISGFTSDYGDKPLHYLLKEPTELLTPDRLASRMAGLDQRENLDGESILWAHDRLIKQKEKRKLLIVLSDGQPAGGYQDITGFTKDVVKEIESKSPVEIYGVGILTDAPRNFYKNNILLKDANDIERCVFDVIKGAVL